MVRILSETPVGGSLRHIQAACKSTDTKPTDGVITGSICLEVDTGDMYLYDESGTGEWSKVSSGISIHICSSNEYDATTRVPTVTNPDASTFYLVPAEDGTSPDLFVEWIYVNNAWEMFGSASVDLSGLVSDVQVNGTSVVTGGVANVPVGNSSRLGVFQIAGLEYGLSLIGSQALYVAASSDNEVKAGKQGYKPVVPEHQHQSVFYGMAKAAGDTTQKNSNNSVGTYTETAKSKISDMLHAPEAVTGTTPTITALAGVQYVCGEVSTLDITLPASGCVDVRFESGSTPTVLTITPPSGVTVKWAGGFDPTSLEANTVYEINIADGLGVAASWT